MQTMKSYPWSNDSGMKLFVLDITLMRFFFRLNLTYPTVGRVELQFNKATVYQKCVICCLLESFDPNWVILINAALKLAA